MPRPAEILLAERTRLTLAQQAFRRAAKHRLDFALPLDIWFDHHYSVLPAQRAKPLASNGQEQWFGYEQVVRRGVNPRSRRRIVLVSGGTMS